MSDDKFVKVTVTVDVAKGETCLDVGEHHQSWCRFYRGKSCNLFGKVIVNKKKCKECLTMTTPYRSGIAE